MRQNTDKTLKPISETNLSILRLLKKGKVRDIYELEDRLLIVATDRISCFDVVLPDSIPYKGIVLTKLSKFWFDFTGDIIKNHLISTDIDNFPTDLRDYHDILINRTMLVKKTQPLPIECVVRGYLSGSAWKEYKEVGTICGIKLPKGLRESEKLPSPLFTPATKEDSGHDINITSESAAKFVGKSIFKKIEDISIAIYEKAVTYAEKKGIIIADTKFEFGLLDNEVILIDELLTPDSSRFWPKDKYKVGKGQSSFDKQFVRDYLENIGWNKNPPAPRLTADIIKKTTEKYLEAYKRITALEL